MPDLPKLLAGAAIALAGAAALTTAANADHPDRYRWNGPEGHFVVEARACADLREDLRDRRDDRGYHYGHRGYGHDRYGSRHSDRRDRRVLNCPRHAWHYVPSPREARMGRYGERLHPTQAVYDRRAGGYVVQTRWNYVPVQIDWRGVRGYRHDRHGYRGTGLHFEFRF